MFIFLLFELTDVLPEVLPLEDVSPQADVDAPIAILLMLETELPIVKLLQRRS